MISLQFILQEVEINMESKFKTNDISLASFLLTQGVDFIDIIEEGNSRFVFLLSDPEKCELLRREYLNDASAPAQKLFSKREMLISQIKQFQKF
ncbi:hypothetical protein A3D01_04695 [Candidatus Woesebacteria bacterium RIFCSPHIGHO2_02_FULL_39_13]|uniref:DUF5659 domain-containing protein n=1 Tax=Candidatus Woesebacteria bacterium RIFCSPHIGHO2_02_FULL_39_13 TaxID=1802505 RepID=A0A1F7YYB5_9BACT|nr:MAG: hypothetical protein A2692_03060 [Candidatus Woesebacteria bacterium RIFCSPHIGHO2_01_FULL_39_95]OGM32333.1 MAG: hypothetical protein A3D01_04695 [Candidatus Woesebacteria bacterium RIFCSPHIGHO2_02_FULL_39_13]OGM37019.1 MAG: hypothetical protein A3E13_03655 [Candidatus Woesebacteria bacterium RIFCSPHIGHO2_12_FULL_40_20]OGM72222.1 MAG: hypothetical protein A3H19_02205 [Candidatus Woesebacteria bacterium RIFCSPLOWO2_12_FULL_39_9]